MKGVIGMFVPRLKRPEQGNRYYITTESGGFAIGALLGNPTDKFCDILSNCVGYAVGRFNEIIGLSKWAYLTTPPNPRDFITRAKSEGLQTGAEPQLGAIIVWYGHVAVVEEIHDDGSITTSESGWGCKIPFWTQKRSRSGGTWDGKNFMGFIYQPEGGKNMKGIDVSAHQKTINWEKVKADGIDFTLIRAGYGKVASQEDKYFKQNYKAAKEAGIKVGAYWYSYAMNEEEARQEARVFLQVIEGLAFEFPLYYDVEEQKQFALGKEKVSAIIKAFLEVVEAAGYFVGLYSSYSALQTHITKDIQTRYVIWCAHWASSTPYDLWGIWQYSCTGKVNGISGDVDMDECRKDYPEIIMKKGLNGYGEKPTTPTEPTAQASAETADVTAVINGVTYKGTLTKI